jgi:uncharacterized protein involved in exopolysaccharide biosynthesis
MEFLRLVWRRKWLIAVPVVLATIAAAIIASRMPVVYRSTSRIMIVPQRVPESYVRSSVDTKLEDRLASITQQVLSRTRLERIVTEFNLYADERKTAIMGDLIQRMRTHDIDIETIPAGRDGDAPTFSISFQSADRRTTMRVTERLASLFINENLQDRAHSAENTQMFLEGELEGLARQVDDFAARMEQDRLAHRTTPRSDVIEYEEMQKTYRELLGKRHEARLASALEDRQIGEQFRIIDPARIPDRPEGPDRMSIILFGAGTGLAAGFLMMLVGSMRRTIPPAMSPPAAAIAAE